MESSSEFIGLHLQKTLMLPFSSMTSLYRRFLSAHNSAYFLVRVSCLGAADSSRDFFSSHLFTRSLYFVPGISEQDEE